jgi:hypothetical protein
MPTKVQAARFNNLKARVDNLLKPALETNRATMAYRYGYGIAIDSSATVSAGSPNTVDASDYKTLYINILRIRYHQVGTAAYTPIAFQVGDYATNTTNTDKVEEAYLAGLEALATDMETDALVCHPSQAALEICDISDTPSTWNGTRNHIWKVTWPNAQLRREYFNSGGQIRITPSMTYSGSDGKTLNWRNMVNAIGTISFGFNGTFASGGVGQSYGGIGHDYMSGSYQTAYYNSGGGVYNPNRYTLYAMELSDSVLQFKVELTDPAYGNPDENVLAIVNNQAAYFRPNGTATIDGVSTTTVTQITPLATTVSSF